MKNFAKFILLTFFCTTFNLNGDVVYRIARDYDIHQLLCLYEMIAESDDDNSRLVVLPKTVREKVLKETISRKRLFVAIENDQIISFLKLYLIDGISELENLLTNELRCISDENDTPPQLISKTECNPQTNDPSFTPLHSDHDQDYIHDHEFPRNVQQTFIYYGGAYTRPDKRNERHGSCLLSHAFAFIRDKVINDLRVRKAKELILTYGQVIANQNNTLMRRAFAQEIPQIRATMTYAAPRMITFKHYVYYASMPAFTENMELIPDNGGREGRGNLIVYEMPYNDLTISQ